MKQTIQLAVLLLAMTAVTTFVACKKDKDNPAGKTKTELLTTGSWKMTAFTTNPADDFDGDGDLETNYFDYIPGCVKDDITTFKTNGTADVDEGATKCDPLDPQTESITWSFTNNETKVEIDGAEYTLVELTATTIKVSDTYVFGTTTYTDEITFSH